MDQRYFAIKWIFHKNDNKESDEGYCLKDDVQYLENIHKLHNDLPILSERMKIEKIEKLAANLHDKTEYVIHMRNLKQALNYGLAFKKVHRVIMIRYLSINLCT